MVLQSAVCHTGNCINDRAGAFYIFPAGRAVGGKRRGICLNPPVFFYLHEGRGDPPDVPAGSCDLHWAAGL